MALTNAGKKFVMENNMMTANIWVALSANGTAEQTGSGYSRGDVPSTGRTISAAGVMAIGAAGMDVYTPNAANAPDSTHAALFDAASAGKQLTDWETLGTDVAAPVMGQTFRLTSLTLTP